MDRVPNLGGSQQESRVSLEAEERKCRAADLSTVGTTFHFLVVLYDSSFVESQLA